MAEFDLPSMVGFVLSVTQQERLVYVGHSQGTTIGFAAFSSNAKLASQVSTFVALGPAARAGHVKGAFQLIAPYATSITEFLEVKL